MGNNAQLKRESAEPTAPAFEEILSKLNTVVEKLESGDMPLEDSLSLFEEGIRLSRLGAARLSEAERRVERLLDEDGVTTVIEASEKENEVP